MKTNNKILFAFIVHSRNRDDLVRRYKFLKYVPRQLFDLITYHKPPFVVSRITGLVNDRNENIDGLVIGIPMTARQLLGNRELAKERIIQAVELAKKKGAKYMGLGAMTASLSRSGRDVIEYVKDVYVTTGRTYTILNIVSSIELCVKKFNLDRSKVPIAIVGAAGGIGSGVAIDLARHGYKKFVLIDLERKLDKLKKGIEDIEKHAVDLDIQVNHQIKAIEACRIIVAATSSPEIVIESRDVGSGTIIINDAQPSDVSPDIVTNRSDVLVVEGGVLHTPSIDSHFNFGLAHKYDVFSCLAETLVISYYDKSSHYSIEDFDPKIYDELSRARSNLNFSSCLQNDMGIISKEKLDKFGTIMASNFV